MKVVLQDGSKDCGICALLSIVRYYGGDVSKEYLRELTNTTRNGVSAYNLIEGAKKIGFDASGVAGDMTKIEKNNLPCLAHIIVNKNYKHFVVIYEMDFSKKIVLIMDPAKGRRKLSFAEFKLMSTNNYIFLKPVKKLPFLVNKNVVKKIIETSLRNNKKIIVVLIILIIINFILNIMVAFHFKYLLTFAVEYNVSRNISIISFVVFLGYVFKGMSQYLKNRLFYIIGSIFDETITLKTFKQILLLPYLYYKNRTTGEVITRLKDLTNVKNFLIRAFSFLVTDVVSMIVFSIFLFGISKIITIIVFSFMLFLYLFVLLRNKKKKKIYMILRRKEERVNSYLIESLSNVDTIKGGHIEKRLSDKFLLLYKDLLDKGYRYACFSEVSNFFKEHTRDILLVIVYGIGCYMVITGKKNIGDILLYQSFLMYEMMSLMRGIDLIEEYQDFKVALNRVEDLYVIENENFVGSYYYYNYVLDGDIIFKDLSFKYNYKKILDNINLTIRSREKILLTGESGSGKSSLVKILLRYLEVPYGVCSISGIDINHYHLENIRKNISYVSSNDFLFTDTLYNNITLEKEVREEDFLQVCSITRVDEIIKLRNSTYQLLVEENGFNFSNGEKQRIILARYLLRKSNIYIFDEALGQIDILKEKDILKDMFIYLEDKIVIVISHRFNNKKLYDRVLRLVEGKIIEEKI